MLEKEAAAGRAKLASRYFAVTRAYNGLGYNLSSASDEDAAVKKIWDQNSFGPADLWHAEIDLMGVFHVPSLTLPGGIVRGVGGPLNPAPITKLYDAQKHWRVDSWFRGLIYTLGNLPLSANLSEDEIADLKTDIAAGSPGAIWFGNPSEQSLLGGWIEARMLAAASRLNFVKGSAAYLPALNVLEQIDKAHGQLDECPSLNVKFLFVPDAQVDCGAGWTTSSSDLHVLARLLAHRSAKGLKTIYGVQNLNKLGAALEKKLLVLKPRAFSAANMNAHPDPAPIRAELTARFPPPEEGWFG